MNLLKKSKPVNTLLNYSSRSIYTPGYRDRYIDLIKFSDSYYYNKSKDVKNEYFDSITIVNKLSDKESTHYNFHPITIETPSTPKINDFATTYHNTKYKFNLEYRARTDYKGFMSQKIQNLDKSNLSIEVSSKLNDCKDFIDDFNSLCSDQTVLILGCFFLYNYTLDFVKS